MSIDIKKSANLFISFTLKRLAEIFGIIIFSLGFVFLLSLFTYSPEDPNFIFPENTKINNLFGFKGSFVSDLLFQSIGLISYAFSLTLIITGINIFRKKSFFLIVENIFFSVTYIIIGTLFLSHFYSNAFSLYINGNGGFVGFYLNQTFLNSIILINETIFYYLLVLIFIIFFFISINFHLIKFYNTTNIFFKNFNKKS